MQSNSHLGKRNAKLRRKSQTSANPLQNAILDFVAKIRPDKALASTALPKRYTRYGSLLLLGPTFQIHSEPWAALFASLDESEKRTLFEHVVASFNDSTLTHVAINAPITPLKPSDVGLTDNEIRSPTGLVPVYGDFGPGTGECDDQYPTQLDLDRAYWTQTIQLKNIVQIWAPRWTMFSRGNITEKARILQDGLSSKPFTGLTETELRQPVKDVDVVDFYVGIGYFAFCYLSRGVARVWGWEINGWSVEGLRKGCIENGWGVRVIKIDERGYPEDRQVLERLVIDIQRLEGTSEAIRLIVFWGDNKWASQILAEIKSATMNRDMSWTLNVRHCNLGLLPSSENSWPGAVRALNAAKGGWLHVHQNNDFSAIDAQQRQIPPQLEHITHSCFEESWHARCVHVEQVKTYAPGVVHCVYDIELCPPQ